MLDPKKDKEGYRKHVANLILEMRNEQDLNYRQIAEKLTELGLVTPGGKNVWSGKMIGRIYRGL